MKNGKNNFRLGIGDDWDLRTLSLTLISQLPKIKFLKHLLNSSRNNLREKD